MGDGQRGNAHGGRTDIILHPGDVVIVVRADGLIQYWEQDTPEVLASLERVEELSTCRCLGDRCPTDEMASRWECNECGAPLEYGQACRVGVFHVEHAYPKED